jgi:hypothetical protein
VLAVDCATGDEVSDLSVNILHRAVFAGFYAKLWMMSFASLDPLRFFVLGLAVA